MTHPTFPCPKCATPLPVKADGRSWSEVETCPQCNERFVLHGFPALLAPKEGQTAEPAITGSESSCFYHPAKVAVESCEHCGRFLCSLCDLDLGEQHICPTCLAKGKDKAASVDSLKDHPLHDSIALSLALLPLLFWPLTLITAPLVFAFIFKNYSQPLGLLPRRRWRFWLAGGLAALEIGGWVLISLPILGQIGS